MGQDIKMYRGTSEKIAQHPIEDGALYFSTSKIEGYMDYNGERLPLYYEQKNYWNSFPQKPIQPETRSDCLTFWEENGQNFDFKIRKWGNSELASNRYFQYSLDGENWIDYNVISYGATPSTITTTTGVLFLRGQNNTHISQAAGRGLIIDLESDIALTPLRIKCLGNIETLLDYQQASQGAHFALDNWCFAYLFLSCTALTQAPSLPSTELNLYSYYEMFQNCTQLITIPQLPNTDYSIEGICIEMFKGCTLLKISESQDDEYTIPYQISGTLDTTDLPRTPFSNMFQNTGGTFKGTPSLNTTYYLSNTNSIV